MRLRTLLTLWTALSTASAGEVELLHKVGPVYPEEGFEYGDQRCLATVKIAEDGVPYEVEVEHCPEPFVQPTVDAILQWRWGPPTVEGQAVKAQITIGVNYKAENRPRDGIIDPYQQPGASLVGLGVGLGWQHAGGDGSGTGIPDSAPAWTADLLLGRGVAFGMEVDQRIALAAATSGTFLLGGCPTRRRAVVPGLFTGFGWVVRRGRQTPPPGVWDLFVPVRALVQLQTRTLRARLSGGPRFTLFENAPAAEPGIPGTSGWTVALAVIPLIWEDDGLGNKVFGPRLDLSIKEELGFPLVYAGVGVGG